MSTPLPTSTSLLVTQNYEVTREENNNMKQEHAARRNKEHKELEDEGDGRHGIAENLFVKVHHLGLIDLVGVGTCRFTPAFQTVRCSF
jgi:hypothetical protein